MSAIQSENEQNGSKQLEVEGPGAEAKNENAKANNVSGEEDSNVAEGLDKTDKNGGHHPGPSTSSRNSQQVTGKKRKHKEESADVPEKIQRMISGGKYFKLLTGNTLKSDEQFIDCLKRTTSGLQEVEKVQECDFILVFCPIVSRAGTDIEAGLKKLKDLKAPETKPVVFVVLHHTFDPNKMVPDSSRCLTREKMITVDCLFYEDHGLLKCSKNDESLNKITKHLKRQIPTKKPDVSQALEKSEASASNSGNLITGKKYFVVLTGNTLNTHKDVTEHLRKKIPDLQEMSTEQECDFILAFCPIVSRAGTDIEAGLHKLNSNSETKPAVFVVLHHTFDPNHTVPDSSRCLTREKTITVDCLFHEDQGLLQCVKNEESLNKVVNHINKSLPITEVDQFQSDDSGYETADSPSPSEAPVLENDKKPSEENPPKEILADTVTGSIISVREQNQKTDENSTHDKGFLHDLITTVVQMIRHLFSAGENSSISTQKSNEEIQSLSDQKDEAEHVESVSSENTHDLQGQNNPAAQRSDSTHEKDADRTEETETEVSWDNLMEKHYGSNFNDFALCY